MSAEGRSHRGDDAEAETSSHDIRTWLSMTYREYVGEPEQERDIYLGFGLFFGGIVLGFVGFVVFLYSGTQPAGSALFWQLRQVAILAGMLGLPMSLASFVVLLPVGQGTRIVTVGGIGFSLVAVGALVTYYPYAWTKGQQIDGSVVTIGAYAIALVLLSASTGSALVAQYLDNATEKGRKGVPESEGDGADVGTVSDEEVASDIESALSDSELSWGGVEQKPDTKRLQFDTPDDMDDEAVEITDTEGMTTRAESDDVDAAVSELRQLQGGDVDTVRAPSSDEQVSALTEFRERQRDDDNLETGVEHRGVAGKLRAWLFE